MGEVYTKDMSCCGTLPECELKILIEVNQITKIAAVRFNLKGWRGMEGGEGLFPHPLPSIGNNEQDELSECDMNLLARKRGFVRRVPGLSYTSAYVSILFNDKFAVSG
ncbi:hypothetical protein PRIPAC_90884 [Pristionchus pacificus]|uniref:Uncharacterized protein n=1 Tax=Pristionchus pacificus TaxID=54126 RepID=A0A2A6B663_PRIPA|nr:hypothetical protein PRIPAC_90884 [Pristionchus pacificus]|eukprot:PDM61364.1 hypothetical protein PRIPAC_50806 [Pristionchus pacificus]